MTAAVVSVELLRKWISQNWHAAENDGDGQCYILATELEKVIDSGALTPPLAVLNAEGLLQDYKALYKACVNILEMGRDKIIDLGGTCDPVDVMEKNDPSLIQARKVIAEWNANTPSQPVGGDREKLAQWMLSHGFATGHGDTIDDLIVELGWQIEELRRNTHGQPQEWLPMEAAPRDGTYILMLIPNSHHPLVGNWFGGSSFRNGWWVANTMPVQPARWAPIPPPTPPHREKEDE